MKERVKRYKSRNVINILGLDPAFANFGIVIATLDLDSLEIDISGMELVKTTKSAGKVSTDNLRRGRDIAGSLSLYYPQTDLVFSEIPMGSQSAKACTALGIAAGILSCCPVPLIELTALEVKKNAVGKRTASKEEMIQWATNRFPVTMSIVLMR